MSVSNLDVLNSAHINEGDNEPKDHMNCHVYNECVSGKGSNNVASLSMETFESTGLLNNETTGER